MMRLLLLLLSCATLFAQRTPLRVNGDVVNNPNFTNSATVTYTVVGTNISAAASGSSGTAGGIVNPESSPSAINGEVFVAAGTSGTNALPSSRTTNVTISVISKVTDGASAVAVRLDSTNALSTSGAQQLAVSNRGTNVATVFPEGTIFTGRNTLDFWGPPAGYENFISYRDSRAGDQDGIYFLLESQSSTTNYASSTVSGDSSGVTHTLQTSIGSGIFRTAAIHAGAGDLFLSLNNQGLETVKLDGMNGGINLSGIISADGGAFTNTLTLNGVTVSTAAAANPTATIGLTAVNGSATTFLRSDGAPALPSTGGAYSGSILVPWVGTNNAVTLRWKKAPQVWEFANAIGEWTSLTANSGTVSLTGVADGQEVGLWTASTGALTNGVAGTRLNLTALLFGSTECAIHWRIKTPPALSSDADGYELYVGAGDAASGTDGPPTDGAFFYYLHSVSNGVWCAKTINNTAATFATGASSTPPAVTAGVWWDLLLYGTSTTINFFVSSDSGATWAYIGSSSSNIPSAVGRETSIQAYIRKVGPNPTGTTAEIMSIGRCVLWPM